MKKQSAVSRRRESHGELRHMDREQDLRLIRSAVKKSALKSAHVAKAQHHRSKADEHKERATYHKHKAEEHRHRSAIHRRKI